MPGEWLAAVTGLVGALAGSGVTLAVGYMQRSDTKSNQRSQDDHRRRQATIKHLAAADAFLNLSRELTGAIGALPPRTVPSDLRETDSHLAGLHARYVEAWHALEVSLGEVQLTLPEVERKAAARLVEKAGDWSDMIDSRWRASRWLPGVEKARDAAYQARRDFIAVVLGSPTAPPVSDAAARDGAG